MNKKIIFTGPCIENTGYSYINKSFVYGLSKLGFDMGIENIQCNLEVTPEEIKEINKFRNFDSKGKPIIFHDPSGKGNDKYVKVVCWLPLPNIPRYHHNISYTMMESKDAPENMCRVINTFYNSCWVPTHYYKNAFKLGGVNIPISVVPVGIKEEFNPSSINSEAKFNYKVFNKGCEIFNTDKEPEGFKFIAVSRWSYRKGFDALLKSYLKEFKKSDNVCLLIFSKHAPSSFEKRFYDAVENDIKRYVEEFGNENSASVYWCSDNIENKDMPTVYSKGDVYVSTSRGEGLSLPTLEASNMNLPVIIPNHTGFTDYATNENSYLVEVDGFEVCNGNPNWNGWITKQFHGQQFPIMGDPVVEQVSYFMRYAKDHQEENKIKNEKMKELIKEKYNWERCLNIAKERLLEVD